MKINLKWRRDNGKHEVLGFRNQDVDIEVHVDRYNRLESAFSRKPNRKSYGGWNALNATQPIWKDLERAVAAFVAEREVVLAEVTADAVKAAQLA